MELRSFLNVLYHGRRVNDPVIVVRPNHAGIEIAIGMPGVAATGFAGAYLMETVHDKLFRQLPGFFEVTKQFVALGIDIGRGDMGDLSRPAAQADTLVVNGRPDPDGPAIRINLVRFPEPNVMTLPGI